MPSLCESECADLYFSPKQICDDFIAQNPLDNVWTATVFDPILLSCFKTLSVTEPVAVCPPSFFYKWFLFHSEPTFCFFIHRDTFWQNA